MRMLLLVMLTWIGTAAYSAEVKYQNDFEKAEVGSVPEDFLVLLGDFQVKEQDGNKFLQLPGAPLDTFGLLFGPNARENISVTARFLGTNKGRRFPAFDVGLNGVGGYKLRVSASKRALELYRGDTLKKSVPLEWTPGKWTHLKLEVLKSADSEWKIQGKVWQEDGKEPAEPAIAITDTEEPINGRASVSGMPYSGTPIRFDDFVLTQLEK